MEDVQVVPQEVVLQPWVLEVIKAKSKLKGIVADELGIATRTLEDILPRNPKRLTQIGVLLKIEEFLQKEGKDIKYIDLIYKKDFEAVA